MIKPHGSDTLQPRFVYDTAKHAALSKEAESLPSLLLNSSAAANAVMLGAGYFNPLSGYMNLADALSVAKDLRSEEHTSELQSLMRSSYAFFRLNKKTQKTTTYQYTQQQSTH